MNPEILAQLKDIQTPEAVGIWPLAWGWWAVIILTVLAIISIIVAFVKRHRLLKAKKQALALMASYKTLDARKKVAAVNDLLKRVNLAYQNRQDIAELSGNSWADWLNQHDKNIQIDAELLTLIYQPNCTDEAADLFYLQAKQWINKALPLKPVITATDGLEVKHV